MILRSMASAESGACICWSLQEAYLRAKTFHKWRAKVRRRIEQGIYWLAQPNKPFERTGMSARRPSEARASLSTAIR
jgi:hypothetical protein